MHLYIFSFSYFLYKNKWRLHTTYPKKRCPKRYPNLFFEGHFFMRSLTPTPSDICHIFLQNSFLQCILAIPLVCRSWKGLGTLDSLHAFCGSPCERLGKLPLKKREIFWVLFRAPLFLCKWCGVATYFFIKKIRKNKYMIELFSSLIE